MENRPPVREIIAFCESFLEKYGDSAQGVGWPRGDADTRYRVMLEAVRQAPSPVRLLDFGCGAAHFLEYLRKHGDGRVEYSGLDLSERFLALARQKFPGVPFFRVDVLDPGAAPLPLFDYIVMNGIFNYRGSASPSEMFEYLRRLVRRVFERATEGIAFNVMSKQVEWERDDLFHLPLDPLLDFLSREVSRHVVIRHDYGLYEYTAYVYKTPGAPEQSGAKRLLGPKGTV